VFAEDVFSGLKEEYASKLLLLLLNKCKDKTLVIVSNNERVMKECNNIINLINR
jgi:ABC-type transport system involved in cytochrome bd biosynthesis fused ATPase/permease subunit